MALAGFAVRSGDETRQMQVVCVDDLVAADDELRRIELLVDWGHVRQTARPFYRAGGAGRSGIDPAGWSSWRWCWRGVGCRRCARPCGSQADMSIRRFLGFGLTERLPDHSTFSHAQTKRFADSSVFEQLFTAVLRQCTEAGLLGGRRLLVDATHIEADAALKSLRAELARASARAPDWAHSVRCGSARPRARRGRTARPGADARGARRTSRAHAGGWATSRSASRSCTSRPSLVQANLYAVCELIAARAARPSTRRNGRAPATLDNIYSVP
jgi:hypothetical protein